MDFDQLTALKKRREREKAEQELQRSSHKSNFRYWREWDRQHQLTFDFASPSTKDQAVEEPSR